MEIMIASDTNKVLLYNKTTNQIYDRSPRSLRANARSFGWMVTRFAWMAARLVSSKRETRYASAASWRAITADDWKRRSVCENEMSDGGEWEWDRAYLEILCDFTNKTLEGELPDEELCRFLVATNFTERNGSGTETMRLLDTTSGLQGRSATSQSIDEKSLSTHGSLTCRWFSGKLFTGRFA